MQCTNCEFTFVVVVPQLIQDVIKSSNEQTNGTLWKYNVKKNTDGRWHVFANTNSQHLCCFFRAQNALCLLLDLMSKIAIKCK